MYTNATSFWPSEAPAILNPHANHAPDEVGNKKMAEKWKYAPI